jgi:hypothetical protein
MGRYRDTVKEVEHKAKGPHPIWRGIGCGLIILVPVLSFALASLSMPFFIERGLIPQQLLFTPQVPDWLVLYAPNLAPIVRFLFGRFAIYATLMLTFVFIIILGGIFSVLYAFMYRTVAPARYGPMDAPPPKVKIKRYKR